MAAKLGFEVVKQAMLRLLMKKGDDGIVLTLPKNEIVDYNAKITMDRLISNGIDPDSLTSPDQVINVLDNINNQIMNKARVIPSTSAEGKAITEKLFGKRGEVISFKDKIEAMKKSGDIVGPDNLKVSEKVTEREMFKNSNLNKKDSVTETVSYIKTLEPMDAMKEANSVIGRKGKYKNLTPKESQRILKETDDHIFERDIPIDPEDMATGGRAGFANGNGVDDELVIVEAYGPEGRKLEKTTRSHAIKYGLTIVDDETKDSGRAGLYTGGMVDVEPNLSDIGHGSDALMARTRLVAPDSQATTSTGLNYLLAEDNDNIRVPFAGGYGVKDHQAYIKQIESELHAHFKKYKKMGGTMKFNQYAPKFRKENYAEGGRIGFSKGKLADAARRKFMKTAGAAGAGIAALKTGLLGFGEKAAPVVQKAVETVSETAQGVPPYFLNLVNKIRKMGESTLATKDKANAYKFKDYVMEEDFAGNIEIIKKERGGFREDVYMSYKVDDVPIKGKKGSTKVEEYEEYTARPDQDGKMKDVEQGVPDEVVQEGTMFEDDYTDFGKADGGRIGFAGGKLAINAGRKFLEKVFGKERFATMIDNDPRMEQGMLEVVDMFRKKDKKGLKMYLQKYLPHMDDAEIEDFIIGSDGTEGITGQLIRLGSGREYESLMDLKKQSDQMRKLEDFNIEGVSKNAEGGRIGLFLGGGLTYGKGLLREMLKFMSKDGSHKKSPAEILKMMNPKQYEKLLNNPKYQGQVSSEAPEGLDKIIQDMIGKTKTERSDMINDIISASRNIKKVDDDILNYKLKIIEDMVSKGIDREIAVEAAENISKEVAKNAGKKASPNITDQGLLELENIQKNLVTKDRRKLQAQGGLTTMLGE